MQIRQVTSAQIPPLGTDDKQPQILHEEKKVLAKSTKCRISLLVCWSWKPVVSPHTPSISMQCSLLPSDYSKSV